MPTLSDTAPPAPAESLSREFVEDRLAACVNRVACDSVYRWEGGVHDQDEVILLVKTSTDLVDDCVARIEERHPDDVQCIERFEADDAVPSFESWRDEAVETAE